MKNLPSTSPVIILLCKVRNFKKKNKKKKQKKKKLRFFQFLV